jgi:tripartite-type tricarboxylate transporter receptor subunit TctC
LTLRGRFGGGTMASARDGPAIGCPNDRGNVMDMSRNTPRALFVAALFCTAFATIGAQAQSDPAANYPSRPVRGIVPFAAGGGTDFYVRILADRMFPGGERALVVENRPGGGGVIAAELVKNAPPDGYTLLLAPMGVLSVAPVVSKAVKYDPLKDFIPISLMATFPFVLAVNPSVPAKTPQQLAAWAKANPKKANFGGSSPTFRLFAELFKQQTGAPYEFITYKGSNETVAALMSGEIAMTIVDSGPVTGPLKAGNVRGLAVTSSKRVPAFADLPTMAEAGIPGSEVDGWAGFFAPAGTPPAIVKKLEAEVQRVIAMPDVKQAFETRQTLAISSTGEEMKRIMQRDIARWTQLAKEGNIQFD